MEQDQWKTVDGIEVIGVQRARTPLYEENEDGSVKIPAYFQKAVVLNLADGTSTFGCVWPECGFTAASPNAIASGHWKVHDVPSDLRRVPFRNWTLEEILGRLMDYESDIKLLEAQRDKAIQRNDNREALDAARKEIKELKAQIREYQKIFNALGRVLPNAKTE